MIPPALERRLLQAVIAVAGLVPVGAGGWGAFGGLDRGSLMANSQGRYLSGLLLGIGLVFWWTIPTIERRAAVVRTLTFLVLVGGLARLASALHTGVSTPIAWPLVMELGVTPLLALWRERVERRVTL